MMPSETFATLQEKNKTIRSLYSWGLFHILCTVCACYTAVQPLSLPNASLLCYGFAAIGGWQMMYYLNFYTLSLLQSPPDIRRKAFWVLLSDALLFTFTGIASLKSTFALFPHPNILERFPNVPPTLYVPMLVYVPALAIVFYLSCKAWQIRHGYLTRYAQQMMQNSKQKDMLYGHWLEQTAQSPKKVESPPDDVKQSGIAFPVAWPISYGKRMSLMVMWMCIPFWLFIAIPWRSYDDWREWPTALHVCMALTLSGIVIWLWRIMAAITYRYSICDQGISRRGLAGSKVMLWAELQEVLLYGDFLVFKGRHNHHWQIFLHELAQPKQFWQCLQRYLPLQILLITEDGWRYLRKIFGSTLEEQWVPAYQTAWHGELPKEDKKQKRKKQKSFAPQGR
jgi:hypothetical protein